MKIRYMEDIFQMKTDDVILHLPGIIKSMGLTNYSLRLDKSNNLYVDFNGRTPGTPRPMLAVHADTVHAIDKDLKRVKQVYFDARKGVFFSPEGIGGDDRAGIIVALMVASRYAKPFTLAIFQDEECGGLGSSSAEINSKEYSYAVTLDRRGNSDVIFQTGSFAICSKDMQSVIEPIASRHGYREAMGMFTDAENLANKFGISSINVSVGYHHPHTNHETVNVADMEKATGFVIGILKTLGIHRYTIKVVTKWADFGYLFTKGDFTKLDRYNKRKNGKSVKNVKGVQIIDKGKNNYDAYLNGYGSFEATQLTRDNADAWAGIVDKDEFQYCRICQENSSTEQDCTTCGLTFNERGMIL